MCYLQMLSPIKTLEYRQIQTSIWVMFQNCTFKSIICNSEHIFPQKQWQAGLERPILPMMYLKCGSIQKSTVETQIKKKKILQEYSEFPPVEAENTSFPSVAVTLGTSLDSIHIPWHQASASNPKKLREYRDQKEGKTEKRFTRGQKR